MTCSRRTWIAPERPPRFVHPLLRAAVYDGLPAASRQNLHRRAAEILASNAAEPEVVAAHLLRCEPGRSTDAVKWLEGGGASRPPSRCPRNRRFLSHTRPRRGR